MPSTPPTTAPTRRSVRSCSSRLSLVLRFRLDGLEVERNRPPEQSRLHLHRQMTRVVRVPDPDLATVLHHALISGRLHFDGLKGPCGCLDLLFRLDFHPHGYGSHTVCQGEIHRLADIQRL